MKGRTKNSNLFAITEEVLQKRFLSETPLYLFKTHVERDDDHSEIKNCLKDLKKIKTNPQSPLTVKKC